jgi:hypothetical protein
LPLVVGSTAEPGRPLRFAIGEHVLEAIGVPQVGDPTADATSVRTAIRARGCPSETQLVGMVKRSVVGNIGIPLSKAVSGKPLTRAEQRELASATGMGANAWNSLYCCLGLIAEGWGGRRSVESLAAAREISPKTVWVRCQRLFHLTWLQLCAWHAWEGLVEQAMRGARRGTSADP